VLWEAGRPVVASPFGVDGGEGSYEDVAAWFLERDAARGDALLASRRVRFVLLSDPLPHVRAFALDEPARAPIRLADGYWNARPTEGFRELLAARLYATLGSAIPAKPALGTYRLVDETASSGLAAIRLFERVPGARLRVTRAEPGATVAAETRLTRPDGVAAAWRAEARADASGAVELTVPYATGRNGRLVAGSWLVTSGSARAVADTTEADVLAGSTMAVVLTSATAAGAYAR
jgi:hypothetical protein